jgi:Stress responsive A/B Barrel Domain
MAVLHMAMFRWFPGVTEEQVGALCADLALLPERIEGVRSYRFGSDLGLRDGNLDFGVVAELDGPDDVDRYLDHPLHVALVAKHIVRMVALRQAVQISLTRS